MENNFDYIIWQDCHKVKKLRCMVHSKVAMILMASRSVCGAAHP
jgi:hypothetical protein